jgi:DNA polymerase-4
MTWVLHVDLDQFIAAVEVLRRPELAGLPVMVGGRGDPTERGVVSTASYEAREFGVGSGMPLRLAARKCPDAVFLPVDREAYDEASAAVMGTLRGLEWGGVPVVLEVLGWDEAFLAAGPGHGELGDPRAFAEEIRTRVLEATRLHCSVGIGDNKLRAKIATDFGKPRGVWQLTEENWSEVMGDRPTEALWGIGRKTAKKLEALGIRTVTELAESDARVLAAELGPTMGPWYHRLGRGVDTSPVDASPWVPRAHGREETFQDDLEDWGAVADAVRELTRRVVADIDREGRPAARVGLKVRYRPFFTVSRSLTLPEPTNDVATLAAAAVSLLDRVERDRPVRLLGVRLEMTEPEGGY